jgi:2-dehydro-3-deoxygalactonokinase
VVADRAAPDTTPSYLSGLLIGAEIASVPGLLGLETDANVVLLGEPSLCRWYARALGPRAHSIENGDQATLAGLTLLNRELVA